MNTKNILRKTRNCLASLVLFGVFAGCDKLEQNRDYLDFGKRIVANEIRKKFKTSPEKIDPKNEERFARTIYVGISDPTTFYFCDKGKVGLRYCGMPSEDSFSLSSANGRFNFNYSADKKLIMFFGHKFEVLNVTSDFIELDHSVCPLTR